MSRRATGPAPCAHHLCASIAVGRATGGPRRPAPDHCQRSEPADRNPGTRTIFALRCALGAASIVQKGRIPNAFSSPAAPGHRRSCDDPGTRHRHGCRRCCIDAEQQHGGRVRVLPDRRAPHGDREAPCGGLLSSRHNRHQLELRRSGRSGGCPRVPPAQRAPRATPAPRAPQGRRVIPARLVRQGQSDRRARRATPGQSGRQARRATPDRQARRATPVLQGPRARRARRGPPGHLATSASSAAS